MTDEPKQMNLVFLPATDHDDEIYGSIPEQVEGHPDLTIRQVLFPKKVWYNKFYRKEAIKQIRAFGLDSVVLVGFSKSGLGAWNITREIPELVSATIIFDAPVGRIIMPPWNISEFYINTVEWQEDLPFLSMQDFHAAVSESHHLILLSGAEFHDEMHALSHSMAQLESNHLFLNRSKMEHHWNSGWIEDGVNGLIKRLHLRSSHG